jgi:hypothetical protein
MEMLVERIQPERLFSYRWHPYAVETTVDYSQEPMTLVEFQLDEAEGSTQLTIVESGFDQISEQWDAAIGRLKAFVEE